MGDIRTGGCSDHAVMDFTFLRDTGQGIRKLNFRKVKLQLVKELVDKTPGKLFSRTREQGRAGRSLRRLSVGHKNSPFPGVESQERKTKDWLG